MKPEKKTTLKDLVAKEQIFAPCIWDCFSAQAAEVAGFKSTLLSGGALSHSWAGVPDIGLMNAEELIAATERIAAYSSLPMVVDTDEGYGEIAMNSYRTCRRLAKAGAMGITLDDTTGYRGYMRWGREFRDGVAKGKVDGNIRHPVVSMESFLSKIKAGLDAVSDTDCLLIARTEAKLGSGFDEAIERMQRARELGAEMTLIIGLMNFEECKRVAKEDPGWKMYPDVQSVNRVPDILLKDIEPLGFNYVTTHIIEAGAMGGMVDVAKHVWADQNTVYADNYDRGMTMEERRRSMASNRKWLDWEMEWNAAAKK